MNSVMLLLAQAAPVVAPAAEGGSTMDTIIKAVMGLAMTAITMFLLPFLKRKSAAAAAEAVKSNVEGRGVLADRAKAFLFGEAGRIAEKEFPKLAGDILAGKFKGDGKWSAVKDVMKSWGVILKKDAIDYFGNQGIDLVAALGDKFLDKLIMRAADAVSPFPGKETAVELLTGTASDMLFKKGVEWTRAKFLDTDQDEASFADVPADATTPSA